MALPTYFDAMDYARMVREYPLGPDYEKFLRTVSRDELYALQNRRFVSLMKRGWVVKFYQRLWGAKGIQPGDIKSLEDIARLPTYSKADIMDSIERAPPFGDFHGMETYAPDKRPPVVLHTTSGTTGTPQVLLFGPWSREIQNIMLARLYMIAGLRPDDVVHSVYGHGMINGGHYIRETFTHWTNSILLTAGTGNETRSIQQVQNMARFGVTVIVGFADYIKKLAQVAEAEGLKDKIKIRLIIGHMGRENKEAISESWGGAEIFDWYGVGDTGTVGFEGPDHDGLYLHEDAHYVELVDPDTGAVSKPGDPGNLCVTCLFKDDIYPIIRFDTKDLSAFDEKPSACGYKVRRIQGFLGRSDNMVKLRGINIYPIGVGAIANEHPASLGEYICRVDRDKDGRDDMAIIVEVREKTEKVRQEIAAMIRAKLGVEIGVELASLGDTAPLTGVESRQKAVRLIDNRFK